MLRSIPRSGVVAAVAAACLTAGCTVGPDYKRPQLPSPPQYRFVEASQAESLADAPWWKVFDDPALQALIKEAIANNLDVKAAAARVEEARARAGIAKSYLYPQVEGAASGTIRQASNATGEPSGDHTSSNAAYGFQLSWELDLFGRLRRQHEAEVAVMFATEQARRGVLVTLVGDVATNYFLLRELDLQLDIARKTLALNDQSVEYFRNRLQGGVSNRLELDRIVANRARTAATIPDIENQVAVIENAMSLLLGRVPGPIARPGVPAAVPEPPSIPPGLPASLLQRRPDVLAAEQLLVASNADIGAAKALYFPTINLTGFAGGVSGDLTRFMGGSGGFWSLGAGLLQPIFNGGRLRRNSEMMQARFNVALANYQSAALNGYREVANALVTIQKLAEARTHRMEGVAALQDASDLSRSRYDSGLASYLEILTADERLFEQQLALAQTQGAEFRARAELYRALGGGWQTQ